MKFECKSCQTRYTIADEKVRGKILKIRCKKCTSVIVVRGEDPQVVQSGLDADDDRAPTTMMSSAEVAQLKKGAFAAGPPIEWFAMVGGKQIGPLSSQELGAKIAAAEITPRTFMWRDGMGDWKRSTDIEEVAKLLAAKASPPPAPRTPRPEGPPPLREPTPGPRGIKPREPTPAPKSAMLREATPGPRGALLREPSGPATAAGPAPEPSRGARFEPAEAATELESLPASASPETAGGNHEDRARAGAGQPEPGSEPLLPELAAAAAGPGGDAAAGEAAPAGTGERTGRPADPFAAVPDAPGMAQSAPGEQTKFFMAKAGVDARGHLRRLLRFLAVTLGTIGVLFAVVFVLFLFAPGVVIPVLPSSSGRGDGDAAPAVWTAEGMESLREKLLGKDKPAAAGPAVAAKGPSGGPKRPPADRPDDAGAVIKREEKPDEKLSDADEAALKALYGDTTKRDAAIAVDVKAEAPRLDNAPLDKDAVSKTIAENAPSYKRCMDDYIRRNPAYGGGRVEITALIGPSGIVTSATIAGGGVPGDLETCLKDRTKRMIFPKFNGEPFEVTYPLLLAAGGG